MSSSFATELDHQIANHVGHPKINPGGTSMPTLRGRKIGWLSTLED